MMNLTLSVVDQSPMRFGGTSADALSESVKLAQIVEKLGYERYWVAEHHNSSSFSGTSPEILVGQIAAKTNSIRVGSGGVMLSHYSSLKVAEQFSVLNSFYPDRIDLGIGRAPGSDRKTAAALSYPKTQPNSDTFPQQIIDLVNYLSEDTADSTHPFADIKVQSGTNSKTQPKIWLLGSSDYSAKLAAILGLPFCFADFFGDLQHGPLVSEIYQSHFKPSKDYASPKFSVAVQALCAPTEEQCDYIGSSRNVNKASSVMKYDNRGLLPPEQASKFPLTNQAKNFMEQFTKGYVDGNPDQVKEKLLLVSEKYKTKDIGIVTNCYSFEDRVNSYRLIAELNNK